MNDLNPVLATVSIIFSSAAGKKVELLAAKGPVWVIESDVNNITVDDVRKISVFPLTIFFKFAGESLENMYSRVLYDVNDHHQFDLIEMHDVSLENINPEVLNALNIKIVESTDYGCCLMCKV